MKIVMKALSVGALAATAALGTVGTATAAPGTASPAHAQSTGSAKSTGAFASRGGTVVPNVNPVVFSCSYVSLVPFRSFQFTCTVQSGKLQLFLTCSNGQNVFGPVMPAINTYTPVLSCPVGTQATGIMWQAV